MFAMFPSPSRGRTKRCAILGILLALHGLALRPAAAAAGARVHSGRDVALLSSRSGARAVVLPARDDARRDFHLKAHFLRRHHRRSTIAAGAFELALLPPDSSTLRLSASPRLLARPPCGPDYPPSRV